MSKVYHNLSGTTEDKFAIGKRGPTFVRGTGLPTAFIDVPDSSIYLREDTGTAYQKTAGGWLQLVTIDMLPPMVAGVYTTTFTSTTEGLLTVNHGLNKKYVMVQIIDNTDRAVLPDEIIYTSNTTTTVDLSTFSITGTWNVIIVG